MTAIREAEATLLRAEQVWDKEEDVREVQNLAAMALQRVEIARATAEQKKAEAELKELTASRDRLLLEARTRQAHRAQEQAERAQREADQAYQQVRSATTQNVQLEQELAYTKEELAASQAASSRKVLSQNERSSLILNEYLTYRLSSASAASPTVMRPDCLSTGGIKLARLIGTFVCKTVLARLCKDRGETVRNHQNW